MSQYSETEFSVATCGRKRINSARGAGKLIQFEKMHPEAQGSDPKGEKTAGKTAREAARDSIYLFWDFFQYRKYQADSQANSQADFQAVFFPFGSDPCYFISGF